MARVDIVMPQMGESITTGTITKWHKKVGDLIDIDEILLDISTDKVESEIPSPVEGKIVELLYKEGDTIDVGKLIAVIDDDANAEVAAAAPKKVEAVKEAQAPKKESASAPEKSKEVEESRESKRFYTPLVKKLAQENGVNLSELESLEGSGAGGRVNREDFEAYVASKGSAPKKVNSQSVTSVPSEAPVNVGSSRVEIIPMDNMRKAIAKNMVASKLTSAHVNSIGEVDMSHLVKFRESFKSTFEKQEGFKLTYTPFIMRAIIMALKEHPYVNASLDGENIVLKKDINLGCAVSVPGNGLVVPVIKNADSLSMVGLCRAVNEIAQRARSKKLSMSDLTGGTFTFTNVGSFGTLMATPVILQPQVGIFASGVIKKRAIVTADDAIAVRSMMYGTHTYDHRLVDGELGGKFLESVISNLTKMDPKALF